MIVHPIVAQAGQTCSSTESEAVEIALDMIGVACSEGELSLMELMESWMGVIVCYV